jgi:hypothetical protein
MLSPAQVAFAQNVVAQAKLSSHPFPGYAAAEACLESAWGQSELCIQANNIFGLKVPTAWSGPTLTLPTHEIENGQVKEVEAVWPVFDSYLDAFQERLRVLQHPMYAQALAANTGEMFVRDVSGVFEPASAPGNNTFRFSDGLYRWVASRWSTDPARASKVLAIYNAHPQIFAQCQD